MRWPGGAQKAADLVLRLALTVFVVYVVLQLFRLLAAGLITILTPILAAAGPAFRAPLVFGAIGLLFVGVPSLLVCGFARLKKREGTKPDEQPSKSAPTSDRI